MDKLKRKIYLDKIIKVIKNDFPLIKNLKIYGFYDQLSNDEMDYVFSGVFEQPVKYLYHGGSSGCVYNENNNIIYYEYSDGYWKKYEHNENRNIIYSEDSNGVIIDKR